MALEEFSIPAHVLKYLRDQGYTISTAMEPLIAEWRRWYTCDDDWYKVDYVTQDNRRRTRRRLSLHPARRVAGEWASLLLNEDTKVSVGAERANRYLNGGEGSSGYLAEHSFWMISQDMVEDAFAMGTAAWALWFDVKEDERETVVKPRTYDARMVVPLSWDDDGVTECAFCTRVSLKGKPADQVQVHAVGEEGTYVISTAVFIEGEEADPEAYGIVKEFDTGCRTPTFAIVRPGIKNTFADVSPYGVSVFSSALDAVKSVDLTWDAFMQEISLTEVMVFMDEAMIDVRDKNGRAVPVPRGDGNRIFRKLFGMQGKDMYEVFSPEIRADPLFKAFNAALAQLGDQCGFGQNYFTLDKGGGIKTATEVSSDNSALMRNIHKHEVVLSEAISQLITSLLTCARIHCGADIEEDFGGVEVFFDDSIITDTQTDKAMMLNEVAAGVVPKWMYLKAFYGMTEDEAKAALAEQAPPAAEIGY